MARLHRSPVMPASLPPGWEDVLTAMTSRDVGQRLSAADAATALRGLRTGDSHAVTTVLRPPPVQQRTSVLPRTPAPPPAPARPSGPGRAALVVGGLLAVVVLAAVGYLLSQQGSTTPREVPGVSADLPSPLRSDLQDFVDQLGKR
jgi:hypothetical protein